MRPCALRKHTAWGAAAPWAFVAIAALLVALLVLNEGLLPRLEVRR